MPSLGLFMSQVFNGLALGVLLSLIAAGLTIIYGTLGVINFAHGALFVVGAYAGFSVFTSTGSFLLSIAGGSLAAMLRSEEHTSELQSLMRISYAVFCLKKKK